MKTDNIYRGEALLVRALEGVVEPELFFSLDTAHHLDGEYLARQELPRDKQVAIVLELKGLSPIERNGRANSSRIALDLEWRVNVLTPTELYNSIGGVTIVEVVKRVLSDDTCGSRFSLVPDVHQFNEPIFSNSLVKMHITFRERIIL